MKNLSSAIVEQASYLKEGFNNGLDSEMCIEAYEMLVSELLMCDKNEIKAVEKAISKAMKDTDSKKEIAFLLKFKRRMHDV